MASNNSLRLITLAICCLYVSSGFAANTHSYHKKHHHKGHHQAAHKTTAKKHHAVAKKTKTKPHAAIIAPVKHPINAHLKPQVKPRSHYQYKSHAKPHVKAKLNTNWFIGASAGAAWVKTPLNHTSVTNGSSAAYPYNSDFYYINQPGSSAVWSFAGGYRWERKSVFFPRTTVSMRFQHFNTYEFAGQVQQYSAPEFYNYNYYVNAYTNTLTIMGKTELFDYHRFAPYISAGIGGAQNTFQFYNESALSGVMARDNPNYQHKTNNNFAYNVGVGVDFNMTPNWTAALGYEFDYLGKLRSAPGTTTWSTETLSLGTLSASTVSLNLFYQIPA